MKKITMMLLIVLCIFMPISAYSALLPTIVDNGDFTTDTTNGLDWLDLTQSNGFSYQYVSTQFGVDGDFEGWRFATKDELIALWLEFGFTSVSISLFAEKYEAARVFIDLFGNTRPSTVNTRNPFTDGYVFNDDSDNLVNLGAVGLICNQPPCLTGKSGVGHNFFRGEIREITFVSSEVGSFLVRASTPVPVPATISLLCFALVAVGKLRKRYV